METDTTTTETTEETVEEETEEIWVPYSELSKYLKHLQTMLKSISLGIDGSMKFIEESHKEAKETDEGDTENDDKD